IGKGTDGDPFVLGVTRMSPLTRVNYLRGEELFPLFHTDATFKLSDLGYPVITCGFSDRSRSYHSAAILAVNARTHRKYELAFGCVTKRYLSAFKTKLRVDTELGAVEDAKFNAIQMWTHSAVVSTKAEEQVCVLHILEVCTDVTKWSTRQAHRHKMPVERWTIHAADNVCGCLMHPKCGICSHVVVARSVIGIGNGLDDKRMCGRASKKKRMQHNATAGQSTVETLATQPEREEESSKRSHPMSNGPEADMVMQPSNNTINLRCS
ncbi:hypothetical protein PHMEG_00021487, partial [Phytophthora megakarya]